jgi:hypothetical protein
MNEVSPRKIRYPLPFMGLFTSMLSLLSLLLILESILRFLPVSTSFQKLPVDQEHPILHFPPDEPFTFAKGWNLEIVNHGRFNNYGFVNNQDYDPTPPDLLFAIIGDSYFEAMMVPYQETLQGRLAQFYKGMGKVYSFGISGAQLAQYVAMAQYVWREFHPLGMVFVIVANDFDESLIKVRSGLHLFKKQDGHHSYSLVRTDYNPTRLEAILKNSAIARYLWSTVGIGQLTRLPQWFARSEALFVGNTSAEAGDERINNSRLAIDTFFSELSDRIGLHPSRVEFLLDGIRPELYSAETLKRSQNTYFDQMRHYFIRAAISRGYEVVDLQPRFIERHQRDGTRFEFSSDGHWNSQGHEVAADAVKFSRMANMVLKERAKN